MDYTDEMLWNSTAIEEMVITNGWKYVEKYIQEKLKDFTTISVNDGFKSIEDFNFARGQIVALKGIITEIESQLTNLKMYREKNKTATTE